MTDLPENTGSGGSWFETLVGGLVSVLDIFMVRKQEATTQSINTSIGNAESSMKELIKFGAISIGGVLILTTVIKKI